MLRVVCETEEKIFFGINQPKTVNRDIFLLYGARSQVH